MKNVEMNLAIKISTLINMGYSESDAEFLACHYESGKLWFLIDGKICCITKQEKSDCLLLGFAPFDTMYYQTLGERFLDKKELFNALSI